MAPLGSPLACSFMALATFLPTFVFGFWQSSFPPHRALVRQKASPYNSPFPPPPGGRRRGSKWIDPELIKQKELEKRQSKQQRGGAFTSKQGLSSRDKSKHMMRQARAQLKVEVDTLIGRLTGIYAQVKDQSNKIVTFGVAKFNPKVASLTAEIGAKLESLLQQLEELRGSLKEGEEDAGVAGGVDTGSRRESDLSLETSTLKSLSNDLESLLQLIESREREVDVLLRSLGMEEEGEQGKD